MKRDWEAYFAATDSTREIRALFREALAAQPPLPHPRRATDLGFGHGVETLALLAAGWEVYAADGAPGAVERLQARVPAEHVSRLTLEQIDLGAVSVPPSALVWAGLSLFFVPPDRFAALWRSIRAALAPGGRFAGQLLGERDTWAGDSDTTALSSGELDELLTGMTVEHRTVQDEDGHAVSGPKHWHVHNVIARMPDGSWT